MNDQYAELYSSYQWLVPTQFNIAQACVHRWAENSHEGRRIALHIEDEYGQSITWSYLQLSETANQLANGLVKMGVRPGDRVVVAMGQRPELVAAYTAVFSVGAVVLPLAPGRPADWLDACLRDAQPRVAIVDTLGGPDLLQAQPRYPALSQIIGLGFQHDYTIPWRTLLARQPIAYKPLAITSASPALLLYPEDAQRPAGRGVVLAHSALIGYLPGFVCAHNWLPQPADVFWTPAPWTTQRGLLDALLPVLYFGRPCVGVQGRFSPVQAYETLERYHVTNVHAQAGILQQMADAVPAPAERFHLGLRSLALDGAENASQDLYTWCSQALGVVPNTVLSLPEARHILGHSHQKWPAQPGSLGRPYPGHLVTVLDDQGLPCPAGVRGELVVNRYDIQGHPDPALFQGYWGNDAATQARYRGDWFKTGIAASIDRHGDFWYQGPKA